MSGSYYLPYLVNVEVVKDYAWGAVCLTYLYRQLGVASRFENAQIVGCLTLLQVNFTQTNFVMDHILAFCNLKCNNFF